VVLPRLSAHESPWFTEDAAIMRPGARLPWGTTRIDSLYGGGLMDRALEAARPRRLPLLVLYPERHENVPRRAI
jgi:hypothetical protein